MENKNPLKILVAGGGIAGLTAALGLRHQGHEVTVFERSELAKEFGAAIHVGPNCHSLLKKLGIFPEALGANRMEGIIQHDENGNVLREMDLRSSIDIWEDPWVLCHRVAIHEKLKEKATETAGQGLPVTLRLASPVINVDPSTATIFLTDGSKHTGDLIIGADGVSSITRKFVVGPDIKPFPYGKNMFRFMIPRKQIRDNPEVAHFVEKDGCMRSWRNGGCTLIMYPCQNNTMMNFAGIHPRDMSPAKGEGWDQEATKEKLLEIFGTFGSMIKEMLKLADSTTLRVWSILDMGRIPRWYNERLVLMGDSAHPFQPFQGQGACIAVEDAVSLVCLLPRGTSPDELPDRLALYQKIRDERAHKVQQATRMSGRDLSEEERKAYDWTKSIAYNFGHNEWHNSTRILKKHLWKRNNESSVWGPFAFSFGPTPLAPAMTTILRVKKYTIRFKTSVTFMKTLFPQNSFNLIAPGTVAQSSYEVTEELSNDGKVMNMSVGLWLHGVRFTRKDGSKCDGSLLVVLLVSPTSSSDTNSITSGFSKLYANIDITRGEAGLVQVRCSQGGHIFLRLTLRGSPSTQAPEPAEADTLGHGSPISADSNLFYFQTVPVVGKLQEADTNYAVFALDRTAKLAWNDSATSRDTSTIELIPLDWKRLPTVHHVACCLAEMPVIGVLGTTEQEFVGEGDFTKAERIV